MQTLLTLDAIITPNGSSPEVLPVPSIVTPAHISYTPGTSRCQGIVFVLPTGNELVPD